MTITPIERVADALRRPVDDFESRPVAEIAGATYVFSRRRGGGSAIVAGEELLLVPSGLSFDHALTQFLVGARSQP
ncbi:MAG TPA: hypothetical protein VHD87_15280 [Acidimicrobiales bacterium]|nr:hypothetical protein [Acidimicrobiales bacterium]